jgi:stearoyl-CoA desaturase (delta-9 desaturase)
MPNTAQPAAGPDARSLDDIRSTSVSPSLSLCLINLATVIIPFAGLAAAIILLWGAAFNWVYLALLGGMYAATAVGVTVGYHRLFTHRSFKTPRPIALTLAALGAMAVEGPLLHWVAVHRRHHQHSDKHDDPHSPHHHGSGLWGVLPGLWHAHMGWLWERRPRDLARYVKDLRQDRLIRGASQLFPLWVLLGLAIPAALGGVLTGTWIGVLLGFIWGGLVRVLLVHHVTWSINSVCHLWGSRPFHTHDESRNNAIFGFLALGEGWHNNHHAFPNSARHGLRWWQLDVSYLMIRGLALLGLARDIRVPSPDRVAAKRIDRSPEHAASEGSLA